MLNQIITSTPIIIHNGGHDTVVWRHATDSRIGRWWKNTAGREIQVSKAVVSSSVEVRLDEFIFGVAEADIIQ